MFMFIASRSPTSPVKKRERACDCSVCVCVCVCVSLSLSLSLSSKRCSNAVRIVLPITTLGGCGCHIVTVIFSHLFPAWHYHEHVTKSIVPRCA